MPAVQTTYSETIGKAFPGMIADMTNSRVESRTVEAAGGFGFGLPVAQGVADKGGILPASTAVTIGISVRSSDVRPATPDKYAQYESMPVLTKGKIWVTVTDSGGVAAGDPVYVVPTTGAFQNDNGSSAVQIPNARWDTSGANGALAVIDLR